MRFILKTQLLAILFSILWVINLNLLAFFDQPGRAVQYINWFVLGFAVLLAIIYFVMTKIFIGRNWLGLPLILIPFYVVYKPLFGRILFGFVSDGHAMIIKFFSVSTGATHLIALLFGLVFGIVFAGRSKN